MASEMSRFTMWRLTFYQLVMDEEILAMRLAKT